MEILRLVRDAGYLTIIKTDDVEDLGHSAVILDHRLDIYLDVLVRFHRLEDGILFNGQLTVSMSHADDALPDLYA